VGTTGEIIAGLWLAVEKRRGGGTDLPVALKYASENILPGHPDVAKAASAILSSYGPHRLPSRFETILKNYDVR